MASRVTARPFRSPTLLQDIKSPTHGRATWGVVLARPGGIEAPGPIDCSKRDSRVNSQNCGEASSPRAVSLYARAQGARPSLGLKVRALKNAIARQLFHCHGKKGGPKAYGMQQRCPLASSAHFPKTWCPNRCALATAARIMTDV
jgi:hypothetical protein